MDQIATNDANQNNKKRTILLLIILLILVVDFCISFGELSSVESESTILEPDFPQMEQDISESPEVDGKNQVSMTYSTQLYLSLSTGEVTLGFQYPARSNQKIQLRLYIQDQLIVESDFMDPGIEIKQLSGADVSRLKAGEYQGSLQVYCYDAATLVEDKLNFKIPVAVSVSP